MTRPLPILALAILGVLPAAAQSIRYAPGEYKYTVTTISKQSQTMGDQKQASTLTLDQRISLLLVARGADSLRFRTVLDDYTLSADLPIQLPDVAPLKGTTVEGVMTAAGRVAHFTRRSSAASGAEVQTLADNMSRFLIALAPTGVNKKSWTDTTTIHDTHDGADLIERTITVTTVDGDTVVAGVHAWRVRRQIAVTRRGTTIEAGQPLQTTGEQNGSGTFCVSVKGVYLGARTTSTGANSITLPDGRTVTIDQSAVSTIGLLP